MFDFVRNLFASKKHYNWYDYCVENNGLGLVKYIGPRCSKLIKDEIYSKSGMCITPEGKEDYLSLEGVEGNFSSTLFKPVRIYSAVSYAIPMIGQVMHCKRKRSYNGMTYYEDCHTTPVEDVYCSHGIYTVKTKNTVYNVKVI